MRAAFAAISGLLIFLCAARAFAHDPGLSMLTVAAERGQLVFRLVVRTVDLPLTRRGDRPGCSGAGVLANVQRADAPALAAHCRAVDAEHTAFEGTLPPDRGGTELSIALLSELPRGHRTFARVLDTAGRTKSERMLTRDHAPLAIEHAPPVHESFFWLGVVHIATGIDHLLFLTLLLLGVDRVRRMAQVVTAFTLAHSLTLALATLGWVRLPSEPVEAAIAASIVVVGLRSCVAPQVQTERLAVTFLLGLVHGLGFASALRELGVQGTSREVVLPLLQFNLGVEAGQLAFGALVLPCLLWARESAWLAGRTPRLVSGMAALAGLVWLLQRTS
ncbi:MAG TPA: HupE/UreJ family protein [Polyangiales bacterium]